MSSFAVKSSAISSPMQFLPQVVAKRFPGARKTRHHRSDRDRKRFRNFLVGHLLDLAEQQYLAKVKGQLFDGSLQNLLLRALNEDGFRSTRDRRNVRAIVSIERHRRTCLQPSTRSQKGVTQDAVDPRPEIRARLK